MPYFIVDTNVPADKIPSNFSEKASDLVANILHKPKSYVATRINPGGDMTFGGSRDPCAVCVLKSIGAVGGSQNNPLAEKLSKLLGDELKIAKNRCYIEFVNIRGSEFAHGDQTFG